MSLLALFTLSVLAIAGCQPRPAIRTTTEQPPQEVYVENFHVFVDPHEYCLRYDYGRYALGWQVDRPNPWSDTLLCAGKLGVVEVTAAKNGGPTFGQTKTRERRPPGVREYSTVWYAKEFGAQNHMSVTDEILAGCPDKARPIAIFPGPASPNSDYGMLIRDGMRACVQGTSLVLYDQIDSSTPALEEFHSFPGFTPAP